MMKNKGITLVALVITIIVLLILAGITISLVLGENGILDKAKQAQIKTDNGALAEKIHLLIADETINKNGPNFNSMQFLEENGYIDSNGFINVDKVMQTDFKTGKGEDKYTIEDNRIYYYPEDNTSDRVDLGEIQKGKKTEEPVDENMFEFDPVTGSILNIKRDYLIDYYNHGSYNYFDNNGFWCTLKEDKDTFIIPKQINGVDVKIINKLCITNVGKIVIPEGITKIGDYAFYADDSTKYMQIKEIVLPNSVTTIGEWTFAHNPGISNIIIPNSVTTIGNYAFLEIPMVIYQKGPNSLPLGRTWGANNTIDMNTETDSYVFENGSIYNKNKTTLLLASNINGFIIPDSVTTIGSGAFSDCTKLTTIIIPNTVTTIERYAFYGCTGLTTIIIPNSVTIIEFEPFHWCTELTTINCVATSKPDGWRIDWDAYCSANIVWGYTGK